MRDTGIASYTIRIRHIGDPENNLVLSNFFEGNDLLLILEEYINYRKNDPLIKRKEGKTLFVEEIHRQNRSVSGKIKQGEFGTVEPILNVETLEIPYTKKKDDAPQFPLYFLVQIPEDCDEGILLLETSGRRGIKGILSEDISSFISSRFPDLHLEINQIMPKHLLNLYLDKGEITEIHFVRYQIPRDIIDAFDLKHIEKDYETLFLVKGKALNKIKGKIIDMFAKSENKSINEFIEIDHPDFEDIKVNFVIDGKHRLMSISHPFSRGVIWNISNNPELKFDDDGHPTFSSIDAISKDFSTDILKSIGIYKDA